MTTGFREPGSDDQRVKNLFPFSRKKRTLCILVTHSGMR